MADSRTRSANRGTRRDRERSEPGDDLGHQLAGLGRVEPDLDTGGELQRQAEEVAQNVTELLRAFASSGASRQDVDELRRLAASVRASDFSGNPDVLRREAREALLLVEQLELELASVVDGDDRGIRGDVNADVPRRHREIVADYYRRLGQAGSED